MIKEILREICNYFEDKKHDRALSILRKKYERKIYYAKEDTDGRIEYFDTYNQKEGSIWHYIGNGVYSYLAKKRREQCKK